MADSECTIWHPDVIIGTEFGRTQDKFFYSFIEIEIDGLIQVGRLDGLDTRKVVKIPKNLYNAR